MPIMPLDAGDPRQLGGHRIVGRLGEGGQGVVYLAEDPSGQRVAVKVLAAGADAKARERLAREMTAAQRVAPFCTARVLASSVDGPRPYVVSEFVDGPSLQQRVVESGPLRAGDLDRLVVGTATALTAIHGAGIIHRDLKPANVLLGPDGPRVVDFGIARATDSGTTTGLVGTPAYFAPEQLNGNPPSPAGDVFAWAATMAYAATGRAPFGHDAIPAVLNRILHHAPDLHGVPDQLAPLLSRCLAKDPAQRPAARELLVALVDPSAGVDLSVSGSVARAAGQALDAPMATTPWSGPHTDTNPQYAPPAAQTHPGGPVISVGPGGSEQQGRRGVVLAVVAGTVAIVVAIGLSAWLIAGSGHKGASSTTGGQAGSNQATGRPSSGTSSSAAPSSGQSGGASSGGLTVPASLAGTWTGTIKQTHNLFGDTLTSDVTISLQAGKPTADATYPGWGCDLTLTLTGATDTVLTFTEESQNANCSSGDKITLTRQGGSLQYHAEGGPSGEVADGALNRH